MRLYPGYAAHVKPLLPESFQLGLAGFWAGLARANDRGRRRYFLWRIRPVPTRLLGPLWRRSREQVELTLTYACNLACYNCNRSCQQDPTSERMSLEQIGYFLDESRRRGIRWRQIRILGGEPTTHPQFLEAVDLLRGYRDDFSPATEILLCTNGHGPRVNRMLSKLPPDLAVEKDVKTSKVQPGFVTFNVAPIDIAEYKHADFCNGCRITQRDGIGVTSHGYYPCGVGAAIDRTFGMDIGRATLPEPGDTMKDDLRRLCRLCGHFKWPTGETVNGPVMSRSWTQAYERSRRSPSRLHRLGEPPAQ